MGATKKMQMLHNEFETAVEDQDADLVLNLAPQIVDELYSLTFALHKSADEIDRMQLTDEEREAVEAADAYMSAAGCRNTNVQKTLRRLLERLGESNVLRDR